MIDTFHLFKAVLKNPKNVGTLVPSSKQLGVKIAKEIKNKDGVVVEFGGGTGSITKRLIESGISPEKLYIFEINEQLCTRLKKKFPKCHVINKPAEEVLFLERDIDYIVSCLPLKTLPKEVVDKTILNSFNKLKKNGRFIQFTYDLKKCSPILRKTFSLKGTHFSFKNLPPARIDTFLN